MSGFFKNIQFYKIEDFTLNFNSLNEALGSRLARKPGQQELSCAGWDKPLGRNGQDMVLRTENDDLFFCMRRDERLLPASVVKEMVEDKAAEITATSGRPVGRKELRDIKDQVIVELLPRAFIKATHTMAYISGDRQWLVVDASSSKKAEDLIELARKTLGSFNVVIPSTEERPNSKMTRWMIGDDPGKGFFVEDECELHPSEKGSVISCRKTDLGKDEVQAHIRSGYHAEKLGMRREENLSFVLTSDLSLKKLKFDTELVNDDDFDDHESALQAEFFVMATELNALIPDLLEVIDQE